MFLPFGTDRALKRPTLITYWLVGVNIVMFALGAILTKSVGESFKRFELGLMLNPEALTMYGFVTYQFLHGSLMHLAGNMVFLYVFGQNLEDKLGRLGFLAFYLLGGVAAGAAHCLFEPGIEMLPGQFIVPPVVGASGSIAAVTGAYMVLFPRTMVRVLSLIVIIGVFNIPAAWLIGAAIIKDLFMHGFGGDTGVALAAHLGGYAFGIGVSLLLLATGLIPREDFDLFSLLKQAKRRRQFKTLTSAGVSPWRADASPGAAGVSRPQEAAAQAEQELLQRRASISRLVGAGDLPGASREYIAMVNLTGEAVMSRDTQAAIANHLYAAQRWSDAATAYEAFIKRFPHDRESPGMKLLLVLINARHLNDPVRAKALLNDVRLTHVATEQHELVRALSEQLG